MVQSARQFAIRHHDAIGHQRKYTSEQYTAHLERVAGLVAKFGGTGTMIAAAWLHDVLEDTPVTEEELRSAFGPEVTAMAAWLTDQFTDPALGNRATRKALEAARLAEAPSEVQTIKLADLIDNTSDIASHDIGFARVYLAEKARLLDLLKKANPLACGMAMGALERARMRAENAHCLLMTA